MIRGVIGGEIRRGLIECYRDLDLKKPLGVKDRNMATPYWVQKGLGFASLNDRAMVGERARV